MLQGKTYTIRLQLLQALAPVLDHVGLGGRQVHEGARHLGVDDKVGCRFGLAEPGLAFAIELRGVDSLDAQLAEDLQILFDHVNLAAEEGGGAKD